MAACASVECATCGEFFCAPCHDIVHGRGKRRQHETRRLFTFYGERRDFGDGEFPSRWPSEILQDRDRGYDFVTQKPTDRYQEMLWEIAQFEPVVTGDWSPPPGAAQDTNLEHVSSPPQVAATSAQSETAAIAVPALSLEETRGLLFREPHVDERGNTLWETFYDYGRQEYRYYHRITKRVTSVPPAPK
ncbi:hypothetical protein PINS_up021131 [Pythium insidiosum]|nr:hypothetical protein PINS_up021131 [Pythium insidiosum]